MDTTMTEQDWLDASLLRQTDEVQALLASMLRLRSRVELEGGERSQVDAAISDLQRQLDALRRIL